MAESMTSVMAVLMRYSSFVALAGAVTFHQKKRPVGTLAMLLLAAILWEIANRISG